MKTKNKNTFGKYKFDKWVPERTQELIKNFWGIFGRDYNKWLEASKEQNEMETCQHGPGPNGFGMPPYGVRAEYFIYDWKLSKETEKDVYKIIEGKYIHRWNNMGSLIDDNGIAHCVSTCDRWVRIFTSKEEKIKAKEPNNGRQKNTN